ncbi:MAG: hypothetical protein LBF19_06420, partial [Prevotellaceae bacterium]|nr:hypothetical protein [Prevotellaceae bacterium]
NEEPDGSVDDADAPRYAASKKGWEFGNQTWSDAIQIPDCNKSSFEDSFTDPQCRSYTNKGKTYYYYNWAYVQGYENLLCPGNWHVPSRSELETAYDDLSENPLSIAWGLPGYATSSSIYEVGSGGNVWTSTERDAAYAYYLTYNSDALALYITATSFGYQVRCVR